MGNLCCPRREPYENMENEVEFPPTPPQFPWPREQRKDPEVDAATFKLASRVYLQVKKKDQRVKLHVDGTEKPVGVVRSSGVIDLTISQGDPLMLKFVRGEKIYHDIPRDDSKFEIWTLRYGTDITVYPYITGTVITGLENGKIINDSYGSDADTLYVTLSGTFYFEKNDPYSSDEHFLGSKGYEYGVWPLPTGYTPKLRRAISRKRVSHVPREAPDASGPPDIIRKPPPPLYW